MCIMHTAYDEALALRCFMSLTHPVGLPHPRSLLFIGLLLEAQCGTLAFNMFPCVIQEMWQVCARKGSLTGRKANIQVSFLAIGI